MREIKFRAWDGFRKRMITNSVYEYASFDKDGSINCFNPFGKTILMQYTGLKDKNGKEIYEGDIVKVKDIYCTITWENGSFQIIFEQKLLKIHCVQEIVKDFEVIGNIYENPELLK